MWNDSVLYEVFPMSFLMEQAGGQAFTGKQRVCFQTCSQIPNWNWKSLMLQIIHPPVISVHFNLQVELNDKRHMTTFLPIVGMLSLKMLLWNLQCRPLNLLLLSFMTDPQYSLGATMMLRRSKHCTLQSQALLDLSVWVHHSPGRKL